MSTKRAPIAPRMLTKDQAADYCGLSGALFAAVCPIPAIDFGAGARAWRWDIRALDAWLDTKAGLGAPLDQLTLADMRGKSHATR